MRWGAKAVVLAVGPGGAGITLPEVVKREVGEVEAERGEGRGWCHSGAFGKEKVNPFEFETFGTKEAERKDRTIVVVGGG